MSATCLIHYGADWDALDRLFTRSCDFQKFDQGVDFTTTTKGNTTEYTTEQITLTPVVGGNVTESHVPDAQFPTS